MPLKYFSEGQHLYVNSRNRLNGTDAEFSYNFEYIDPNKEYDRVVLLSCMIPKTYYVVDPSSSIFTLQEPYSGGTYTISISVPYGNYTRSVFAKTIINLLNSQSQAGYTYNIQYSEIQLSNDDGKFIYTVSGNGSYQPSIIVNNLFFEPFGFDRNTTNTFINNTITSTNIVSLQPEGTLFIHSDICQSMGDNILQDIPATQYTPYGHISYENSIPLERSKPFINKGAKTFNFQLTDEDGNTINLNGLNMTMTLFLYKENRTDEVLDAFIKYITSNIANTQHLTNTNQK